MGAVVADPTAESESESEAVLGRRSLVLAALAASKALTESIDRDLPVERVPAVQAEIVARVLGLTTVAMARARGLLEPTPISTWDDLEATLAPLAKRRAPPFHPHVEGPLFDRLASFAIRAGDRVLERARRTIEEAVRAPLEVEALGAVYEELLGWQVDRGASGFVLGPSEARRRAGAHFTPRSVTTRIVELALEPVVGRDPLDVLVCDPAMGSGAFLLEACRFLAARVRKRSPRTGEREALRRVAEKCLHGVDRDPVAVDVARLSLWLLVGSKALSPSFATSSLRRGDALVGSIVLREEATSRDKEDRALVREHPELEAPLRAADADPAKLVPLHWAVEFPEPARRRGFDAMIGNPPWVSYAGRAAQPLAPALRAYYAATYAAFAGYRNLQALFVERALSLLRPQGRLGFVLPTSMSDLGGYEPSRRAHDTWAICDAELPDLEDGGFEGVFQPCMGLISTKRRAAHPVDKAGVWPLARHDLDPPSRELLAELGAFPTLPAHLFGERGFQSTSDDVRGFTQAKTGRSTTPLRVGGDVAPFSRKEPVLHCDPEALGGRLRSREGFAEVAFYVRQTARFPMAAASDGLPFRNSILAGFADETFDAPFLVAYLNSSPVRWYHYMRHRDARQGMPQMKIAHLRALPAPPREHPAFGLVRALGERLASANRGIDPETQDELDAHVCDLLFLGAESRATIRSWRRRMSAPSRESL